jgi:hypothetical protein
MDLFEQSMNNILMISLHGYVSAEPELGKPDTGGQVVYVLELAKRFSRLGRRVDLGQRGALKTSRNMTTSTKIYASGAFRLAELSLFARRICTTISAIL